MSLKYYSKSDRRAIVALAIIAVLLVIGFVVFGKKKPIAEVDMKSDIKVSENGCELNNSSYVSKLTAFDPNTVDSAELVALGLKSGQARSFIHYREGGAVFRNPLDIARIYTLEDEDIDRLLPYVHIAEKYKYRRTKYPIHSVSDNYKASGFEHSQENTQLKLNVPHSDKFESITKIDINTADTTLLKRVPGIGSNIARWIVERRTKLVGFISVNQLMEVKHFPPDMMEWFEIKSNPTKRIIGQMSFNQMAVFPYIGYEKAKAISNYVRLYGPFKDADALKASNIFTEEELDKLLPYLTF